MEWTGNREPARDVIRAQANREALVERLARAIPADGKNEPLKGLFLIRVSAPTKGL